jgi:hypothetical protein
MILLNEAGKAHVIKQLDLKFEPNEFVTEAEMPQHKTNVYTAWFKHCETKLNSRKNRTIPVGLGYLTFEERMVTNV